MRRFRLAAIIAFLLPASILLGAAPKNDAFSKLPVILEERLAKLHPRRFNQYIYWGLAENDVEPGFDPVNILSTCYEIDFPKDPKWRAVLDIEVMEYKDEATAAQNDWRSRMSALEPSGLFFEDARGFDLLGVQGFTSQGLLGRHRFHIQMHLIAKPDATTARLWKHGSPDATSDNGWYAGMAAFVLDAWQQSQGLPHKSTPLAFSEPGKMLQRWRPNSPAMGK